MSREALRGNKGRRRPRDGPVGLACVVLCGMVLASCGDSPSGPSAEQVSVSSPQGTLLAVGRSVQLTATATDRAGRPITTGFTWSSSNPSVATVSGAGSVRGIAAGSATISAELGGATGRITLQVVDADLAGIQAAFGDAFLTSLLPHLTPAKGSAVQGALGACSTALAEGNLEQIQQCLTTARNETEGASDPTDRVILAVVRIYVDHAQRLLNL